MEDRGSRSILPLSGDREVARDASEHTGLEALLGMAAAQPAFARALRQDRNQAVEASGIALTATERALVDGVDAASLERLVAGVDRALPHEERRRFLQLAGAALLALGGATLAGCDDKKKVTAKPGTGSVSTPEPQPKTPEPQPKTPEPQPKTPQPAGVRPARPTPRPSRGIRPDRPPRAIGGLTTPTEPKPKPSKPKPKPKSRGIRPDRPRPRPRSRGED